METFKATFHFIQCSLGANLCEFYFCEKKFLKVFNALCMFQQLKISIESHYVQFTSASNRFEEGFTFAEDILAS